jgi:hypothetical protein
LDRLLARNFSFHRLDFGTVQDRHGFLAWARLIGDAYLNVAVVVDDVSVKSGVAVVRFHTEMCDGSAIEGPSTGAAGVVLLRSVDDQIVGLWSDYEEFGLLHERPAGSR